MYSYQRTCRTLSLLLAIAMILTMLPVAAIASETTIKGDTETVEVGSAYVERENDFNKEWKFYLGDNGSAINQNFNDSGWNDVNLPHDFSIIQDFTSSGEAESGFLPGGIGWYRKNFVLDEESEGKTFLLNFDGVYSDAYVYVNGDFVGEHHYGYTAFAFDITDNLVCDGVTENVVAVKAVNNIPSSRWYSGSGIYRDVTLLVLDPVHVDLNGLTVTTPNIASGNGTANVKTVLVNDSTSKVSATVTSTVYAKGSETALGTASTTVDVDGGSTGTAVTAPIVTSPSLWSIEYPNLYVVKTEVSVNGTVVDTCETEFGFRWFEFNSSGFYLNGKAVKLNGVCLHHDQGALGAAAYYDAMYRQLSIMKDMGCNAIRTSHNPADEDFIAICNELGLLVIEETFDGLVDSKNDNFNDFSRYFESAADTGLYGYVSGMTCAEYAARSVVKRDKNAPGIIAWSFGNEIQEGTEWDNVSRYDEICSDYIDWVNDEDGTRPVTSGDNNRGGNADLVNVIETITNAGGIAGFNYANSASTLYSLAQSYGGSKGVIIASETSSATNSRGRYQSQSSNTSIDGAYHLTSYDTSSVNWGITAHDSIYNTYQYDCVAGEFVWTGFDYIGEPTPWNGTNSGDGGRGAIPNSSYFGIVETTGFAKDTYYLYRSQWNKDATTVHLVTAWDADNQYVSGSTTPVWLYSNAPKVELYLNGNLIATATRGEQTSGAGHTYYTYTSTSNNTSVCTVSNGSGADALYAVFNVVYTAGTLSTKAYDENGNLIDLDDAMGRHSVTTPGAVTQLKATVNKTEIAADGSSLAYIEVDVLDANGNPDTTASNNITFTLSGPGEIAGVDNGDQATTAKYQQPSVLTSSTSANINAYAGKALVIVRSTEDAGNITLNIASSNLSGQTVKISTTSDIETTTSGLISYQMIRDYSVKAGTIPSLDTNAEGTLSDGSTIVGTIEWADISRDKYNNAGDYTITGTLTFDGYESIAVSTKLHVIPNVIDLRNVSTATMVEVAPTLPSTVRGVLADGTLAGEFAVNWDTPDTSEYDTVGEIVTVDGTAVIFGDETMDVTCTVRVAEAVNTESTNVAPMADSLSQDIDSSMQSDNLNSIIDSVTSPSDSESTRWTNWKNRYNSDTATITLTWATAQTLSDIKLYYRYDSACKKPASVVFSYSLNGIDFSEVGATETALTDNVNYGAGFTYALDEVINPVALKVTFTQQNGTSSGYCVGLYEIMTMTYSGSITVNTSADLSAINVDDTAIDGFAADTLDYDVDSGIVTANSTVNAGITVLPAYEGVIRILTISEDGSAAKTYELTLRQTECAHLSTSILKASDATCTDEGYTGDTYCEDCGEKIASGEVIPATGHQNTEVQNAVSASCSKEGYTGDTYCEDCGEKIATGVVIPVTDHNWGEWAETTSATCTVAGERTRICSVCNERETDTVSATGHQNTEVQNAVPASCSKEGYTGDTFCNDCGTKIASGTVIPVTDHSWDEGAQEGENTKYTCVVCGETKTEAQMKAPTVSLTVAKNTSTSRLILTGKFDDYLNADRYYEVTAHGIVYMQTTRLGKRVLTVNTSGRTRVNFSAYKDDGSFVYNLKPTSKTLYYTIRAFLSYTDPETGKSVIVYSDPVITTYNKAATYTAN